MGLQHLLLPPCAQTVHRLEGPPGLADIAAETWGLGAVPPLSRVPWSVLRRPCSETCLWFEDSYANDPLTEGQGMVIGARELIQWR